MITRKFLALGVFGMAAAGMLAPPASAHGGWGGGWGGGWRGGWGVGVGIAPFYAAPPYYYYPPPAYYAPPPPAYYPPPSGYDSPDPGYITQVPSAAGTPAPSGASAQSCNAGPYVCPMEVPVPSGARCYCPGNSGQRVYGSAE